MTLIVKLSRSYDDVHAGTKFDTVELREPTFRDIYTEGLGEPEEAQPTPGGGVMIITNYQVISQYIDRLAVNPTSDCLSSLNATDSRKLRRAVTGFFREEAEPKTMPDSSSSGSASTPSPSSE